MNSRQVESFLALCTRTDDGFVALDNLDRWRLGTVLSAWREGRFCIVKKAPVEAASYEFADMWALPGGMVRESADQETASATELARLSLEARAAAEAVT